jgi:hypothetical protein
VNKIESGYFVGSNEDNSLDLPTFNATFVDGDDEITRMH